MSSSHIIVMIVFRIINVCVIGWVIWWLSKKYLFTTVEEAIAEKSAYTHGLDQQRTMLDTNYEHLQQEQTLQEKQCVQLLHNARLWKTAHEQSIAKAQSEQEIFYQNIQKRMDQQNNYQEEHIYRATAVPLVIEQATKELTDYFSDPAKANQFADAIIERITKGPHA